MPQRALSALRSFGLGPLTFESDQQLARRESGILFRPDGYDRDGNALEFSKAILAGPRRNWDSKNLGL